MSDLRKLLIEANPPLRHSVSPIMREFLRHSEWSCTCGLDGLNARIDAALAEPKDSQPVPVEPDAIVRWRFIKEKTGGLEPRLVYVLDYIDTLQSELKRVTEERDTHYNRLAGLLFSGALDKLTNTDVQRYAKDYIDQKSRAEAAESLNKRMVELLREPSKGMIAAGYPPNDERAQSWGVTEVFKAMSEQLLKEVE